MRYALRFDFEGTELARLGQFLIDAVNFRPSRSIVQSTGELRKLLFRPDGIHFDAAVIEIAGETSEPELGGGSLREVAETHSLHAPANEPTPRGL